MKIYYHGKVQVLSGQQNLHSHVQEKLFPSKSLKYIEGVYIYMYIVSIHFKKPQNQVSTQAWKTETDKHQHKTD